MDIEVLIYTLSLTIPSVLAALYLINRDREESRQFVYKCIAEGMRNEQKILLLECENEILRRENKHFSDSEITQRFSRPSVFPPKNENN